MKPGKIHLANRLKAIGGGAMVLAMAGVPALESIALAANAVDFIANQPDFEIDPVVVDPIDYGDMAAPAEKGQSWNRVLFGDSLTWGYNANGNQYCVAQMVASDVNRILSLTGVPRLPRNNDGEVSYWQNYIWAEPGTKAHQVGRQIEAFVSLMHGFSGTVGPWTAEASMGGIDAVEYIMDHLNWKKGRYTVSEFQSTFLPVFKTACLKNIRALVNLKTIPALADLRVIEITGIPDIGQSKDLWVMQIPSVQAIATAACAYMNQGLIEIIHQVRTETGFPIYLNNLFGLAMSDIHPSPAGYLTEADRREQRMYGQFPDGVDSFKQERLKHGVAMPETAKLSTMAPNPLMVAAG